MTAEASFWAATAGELAGLAALTGVGAIWLAAGRALRSGDLYDRFSDGFLTLAWIAVVAFWVMAGLGLFALLPVVAVLGGAGVLALLGARRWGTPAGAEGAESAARAVPNSGRRLLLIVALPWAVIAALRLLKGLVSPPMAWDSLTYHLPKAAMWVQTGGLELIRLPDAWSYYRWFPAGSEILWAWLMLPVRSDFLIGPVGVLLWLMVAAAARRFALLFTSRAEVAWMAGLSVATLPCVAAYATSAYADIPELLFILLALTHGLVFYRSGRPAAGALAAAALGLAIAVKTTGLVVAPVVGTLLGLGWRRIPGPPRWRFAAALLALSLLPAFGYVHAWGVTGSPLYPVKTPFLEGLAYHEGLHALKSGAILPAEVKQLAPSGKIVALFWSNDGAFGHLNLGLGGLVLAALAVAGSIFGLARARGRGRDLLLLGWAIALLATPPLFGASSTAFHTLWMGTMGRLLIAGVAPLLLAAVLLPYRIALSGLTAAAVLSLLHVRPLGFSPTIVGTSVIAGVLVAIGTTLLLLVVKRTGRAWKGALAATIVVAGLYPALSLVRDGARYRIWSETGQGGSAFDANELNPVFSSIVPVASGIDNGSRKRLAVTVGVIGIGHNQILYPLFGRRLNHELVYVPMTIAGNDDELDAEARLLRASRSRWLERLSAADPDYLVALWSMPPEWAWVEESPSRFDVLSGESDSYRIARVR